MPPSLLVTILVDALQAPGGSIVQYSKVHVLVAALASSPGEASLVNARETRYVHTFGERC